MLQAVLAAVGTSSGPSVAVHGWVAWIIIVGAVVFALGVIWKFIWPITKAAVQFSEQWGQITEALPSLLKLADAADALLELADGFADLKKRTERIESKVEDLLAAGRATGRQP
ncbi:MAG TPA: hypothetical protein VIJ31_12155 [Acidothermaceae bacterium]